MAPFMPFVAEALWQKLTGNEFTNEKASVHLEAWPFSPEAEEAEPEIIVQMEIVRKIVEMGLAKRDEVKIKIRQPLQAIKIKNQKLKIDNESLIDLIKDELNIKTVEFIDGDEGVELDTTMTPELESEGLKREIVRAVNNLRKEKGL
jgi:isoleucyl-tRNA synthetase